MAVTSAPIHNPVLPTKNTGLRWGFAHAHPVITYLLLTFAWSWGIWFASIPIPDQDPLMALLTLIGAFGPALGGILTLGLKNGMSFAMPRKQMVVMALAALLIFAVMALRALTPAPHADGLPEDVPLTAPNLIAALLMGLYIWRRHPTLGHGFDEALSGRAGRA